MRLILAALLCMGATACDRAHSDSVRLTNQGMQALAKNQVKEAQRRFEEAVDVNPENAKAHYGLGVCLIEHNELEQARRHLREASKLSPELTEAFYQLGVIALKEGKLDEAEQVLRRALEQDPDHDAAHLMMGRIHDDQGNLKEAEVELRKAVTLNPYQADAFLRLARLYLRVDAEKEAIDVLREGIRINTPEMVSSVEHLSLLHNELGILLQKQGKYGEAIDALLKAVRLPGAAPEVVFNLGWAYASKGDAEHALRYFRQYISLVDGGDPSARVAMDVAKHLSQRIQNQQPTDG